VRSALDSAPRAVLEIISVDARVPADVAAAFAAFGNKRAEALMVVTDGFMASPAD
jgi:hypothetical protein